MRVWTRKLVTVPNLSTGFQNRSVRYFVYTIAWLLHSDSSVHRSGKKLEVLQGQTHESEWCLGGEHMRNFIDVEHLEIPSKPIRTAN